jgi:hypothetical protein
MTSLGGSNTARLFRPPFLKVCVAPNDCFVHLFKGGAPRVVAPRRVGAFGVSFLAFFAPISSKKAAKWLIVAKVSGTNCRYQNFYIAFFFGTRAAKKKALQKRNGDFFALTPRGLCYAQGGLTFLDCLTTVIC